MELFYFLHSHHALFLILFTKKIHKMRSLVRATCPEGQFPLHSDLTVVGRFDYVL